MNEVKEQKESVEEKSILREIDNTYCRDCDRSECPDRKCFHRLDDIKNLLPKLKHSILGEAIEEIKKENPKAVKWIKKNTTSPTDFRRIATGGEILAFNKAIQILTKLKEGQNV